MIRLILALLFTLSSVTPAQAILIAEWQTEYVFLGMVGNSTDPTKPFNLFQEIRSELVYDLEGDVATLVFSRVIRPEEYLGLIAPPPFALTALGFVAAQDSSPPLEATPEPTTLVLLGTALTLLGWRLRSLR